jgi:serine/threonine protein kinase/cephalosporin-C deacetylase-like acetyl esterase
MIGQTISHYQILEKLGSGGMGDVYKAKDTKLDRFVALKFLSRHLNQTEEEKKRFIQEAKAASALDHHNICTIYEINETEDGQMYIAMASYDGESLKKKIEDGSVFIDEAVDIGIQIASGLAKAHTREIIHRDIKPANILITNEGQVKLIDFGLAKLKGGTILTKMGTTMGTVAYMSPEQGQGHEVDSRTDVWSFGVVLYELLTGQLPFKGAYEQAIVYSIMNEDPEPIKKLNPAVPTQLAQIVNKALQKKPESRYLSAAEILKDLENYQNSRRAGVLDTLSFRTLFGRIRNPGIAIPAIGILILIIIGSVWFFNRQAEIRWAKEVALPQVALLVDNSWRDYTDAYKLAREAEKYIPNDPKLVKLLSKSSLHINIKTEPPGAAIYMKEYSKPENEWEYIGVSPIDSIRVPIGIFRWKIEKEGYDTALAASSSWTVVPGSGLLYPYEIFRVLDRKGSIPPDMVRASGAMTNLGQVQDFYIDRYEVNNRQFKEFINSGGYKKKAYWKHQFIRNGEFLAFEEAMAEFVDQTGRPGPATWQAGDYPQGLGDYPVSGISWYEAAAYAEFAGKSLPTATHWGLARGESTPMIMWPQLGGYAVFAPFSNFAGEGPVAVGSLPGVTAYGAYDMAGNLREWCWNETPMGRLIRGGAWNDNTYMFKALSQAPPFDRSAKNGFRCALYSEPEKIPEAVFRPTEFGETRDFYKEKPVTDAIFQVYKEQFSYDPMPLNSHIEERREDSENWILERIAFDAAYGGERIIGNLFLPKNSQPPYQTVIYFPGSATLFQESSKGLESYYEYLVFLSFLVKNGRAVLFPVYKGTFERRDTALMPIHAGDNSHAFTEFSVQLVKDLKRSIDYLETCEDIDRNKLAYYGMSWGGVMGAIIPAVEERLQASVLVSGGLLGLGRPQVNAINFLSRVKTPTLMLNGQYDSIFPVETSIKPMFDLLGTPTEHKELKLFESDHIVPMNDFIRETLAWLDRYLGPVK